ncbi:hypothetical protein BDQ17DRAFT_1351454 [Cyathus striatus]|nr:hypothetical protein BDQ17DRAFT_1351454 [Cyathus striatus]
MSETISPTSSPFPTVTAEAGLPPDTLPPVANILPYLSALLSFVYPILVLFFRLLYHASTKLALYIVIVSPLPIVLYILAPVTVFCQAVFRFFVLAPYRILVYLIDAVYPLYVFCGVAIITGSALGLCARGVSFALVQWTLPQPQNEKKIKEDKEVEVEKKVKFEM